MSLRMLPVFNEGDPWDSPMGFHRSFSSDLIFPPHTTVKPKPKLECQPLHFRRLSGVLPKTIPEEQNELGPASPAAGQPAGWRDPWSLPSGKGAA